MTITSSHNQRLKEIRKLRGRRRERERLGRFVAEGEDLLAAADAAGWRAVERYCAAGSGLGGVEVEPALLAAASALGSGTRALGVYEERWAPAPAGPVCVYLHEVSDPGNVGTILRSAEAFRAGSVCMGPGCADPFGPKAVRASMGAIFSVAVARVDAVAGADVVAGVDAMAGAGAAADLAALPGLKVALVAGEGVPLCELRQIGVATEHQLAIARAPGGSGAITLLIGSERHGLPESVVAAADVVAHIPIASHSLNAAMAATVALYEVNRMASPMSRSPAGDNPPAPAIAGKVRP